MKRRKALSALLCALALTLCARSLLAGPKTTFTKEELLADYDQLFRDLYENDPFLPALAQRGVNVEALQAQNREVLKSRVTDLEGFAFLLRDTFYRMGNLAHLMLIDASRFDFYRAHPYPPHAPLVEDPQTQATYALLGAGGRGDALFPDAPEVETRYFPDEQAAYFRFASFDYSTIARDRDVVADALAALGDVRHVIFDVTGNPGGFARAWQENIVSPFGGECVTYVYLRMSPLNEEFFRAVRYAPSPLADLPPEVEAPDFAQELGFTHFVPFSLAFPDEDFAGKRVPSQAKRWVLIDGQTYSAADGFAAFCAAGGWATLVGSPTEGDGANPMGFLPIRLANTGLLVRFSTATAANADGTANAVFGTAPDIRCEKGETPLDACLRAIRSLP